MKKHKHYLLQAKISLLRNNFHGKIAEDFFEETIIYIRIHTKQISPQGISGEKYPFRFDILDQDISIFPGKMQDT